MTRGTIPAVHKRDWCRLRYHLHCPAVRLGFFLSGYSRRRRGTLRAAPPGRVGPTRLAPQRPHPLQSSRLARSCTTRLWSDVTHCSSAGEQPRSVQDLSGFATSRPAVPPLQLAPCRCTHCIRGAGIRLLTDPHTCLLLQHRRQARTLYSRTLRILPLWRLP